MANARIVRVPEQYAKIYEAKKVILKNTVLRKFGNEYKPELIRRFAFIFYNATIPLDY